MTPARRRRQRLPPGRMPVPTAGTLAADRLARWMRELITRRQAGHLHRGSPATAARYARPAAHTGNVQRKGIQTATLGPAAQSYAGLAGPGLPCGRSPGPGTNAWRTMVIPQAPSAWMSRPLPRNWYPQN